MRYRRSCKKCAEFMPEITLEDVEDDGPPEPCMSCRRFYPDNFVERED